MPRLNVAIILLILLVCSNLAAANQSQVKSGKKGTATISGRVMMNEKPVVGVTVVVQQDRMTAPGDTYSIVKAQSDQDGNYRVFGLAAGSYQVNIQDPGFVVSLSGWPRGKVLNIADGENVENFD